MLGFCALKRDEFAVAGLNTAAFHEDCGH